MKKIFTLILLILSLQAYSQSADEIYDKGSDALKKRKHNEAIEYFLQYISIKPDDPRGYLSLGTTYAELKNYDSAFYCYNLSVEKDSNYAPGISGRGAIYLMYNQFELAYKDLKKALELEPESMLTYTTLATYYFITEKQDSAFITYAKALEINPKSLDVYYNRAALYFSKNDYENTLSDVNKLIEYSPDYAKGYYFRGTVYRYMKKFDDAMTDFNKAIELDPDDGETYVRRGILFLNIGKYKEAIDDMEYGYSLNPSLKEQTKNFYEEALNKYNEK